MKKFILNVVLTTPFDAITLKTLKDSFASLGIGEFPFAAEVELQSAEGLTQEVWLKLPENKFGPYLLAEPGCTTGTPLIEAELTELRKAAVCTEFHVSHRRAGRIGASLYANADYATAVIGLHGFKADVAGIKLYSDGSRGDAPEQFWVKLVKEVC